MYKQHELPRDGDHIFKPNVADPIHFFWMRVRILESGFHFQNTDPGAVTQKKDRIRIRILYSNMFLMFSKINIFYGIFLPKHLMTPLIKDKKNYLDETRF